MSQTSLVKSVQGKSLPEFCDHNDCVKKAYEKEHVFLGKYHEVRDLSAVRTAHDDRFFLLHTVDFDHTKDVRGFSSGKCSSAFIEILRTSSSL